MNELSTKAFDICVKAEQLDALMGYLEPDIANANTERERRFSTTLYLLWDVIKQTKSSLEELGEELQKKNL